MAFNNNNEDYDILLEGEMSTILQKFDEDMIYDIISSNLEDKYRDYSSNLSNLVYSLEQNFKDLAYAFGENDELSLKQKETYTNIMNQIFMYYNLSFNPEMEDRINYYTAAFHIYSFFISEFSKNITSFFVNYILKEQESLYRLINIEDKKSKDTSIVYSKKIYGNNHKLAKIHSTLEDIIKCICGFDIDLNSYISTVMFSDNKQVSNYLQSLIIEPSIGNTFRSFIVPYVEMYRPIIITDVRLTLQEIIQN